MSRAYRPSVVCSHNNHAVRTTRITEPGAWSVQISDPTARSTVCDPTCSPTCNRS